MTSSPSHSLDAMRRHGQARTNGPHGPIVADARPGVRNRQATSDDRTASSLIAALVREFGEEDSIVWEVDRFSGSPPRSTDDAVSGLPDGFTAVHAGTGLDVLTALVDARRRSRHSHWIVTTLAPETLPARLDEATVRRPAASESRCLVIVRGRARGEGTQDSVSSALWERSDAVRNWAESRGFEYVGPLESGDGGEVSGRLREIRRREVPAVLHLESPEKARRASEVNGRDRGETAVAGSQDGLDARLDVDTKIGPAPPRYYRSPVSAERCEREQKQILQTEFRPEVRDWVHEYEKVGERGEYLWRWCLHGLKLTTLPCVEKCWVDRLCDTKLLGVMLGVMLDDVADEHSDESFLDFLLSLVEDDHHGAAFGSCSSKQKDYAAFTVKLWNAYRTQLRDFPHFAVYEALLDFDHKQIFNTMRYSRLVNRNLSLLNLAEHDLYLPHNMQMMSFATIDLMCSPSFDPSELGKLREAIWHAQCMGRIGNLVTTWEREIKERDFTSGVFAHAMMHGDLNLDELSAVDTSLIEESIRRGGHESHFLNKWEYHRDRLIEFRPQIRSLDLGDLIEALERLLHMELASRGLK